MGTCRLHTANKRVHGATRIGLWQATPCTAERGLCGDRCTFLWAARADPAALTKQCQSQTKRGTTASPCGNLGASEPRHSPRIQKTQPRKQPRVPDGAFNKSYALFTPALGSKMSKPSRHNTPLRHYRSICKQALHAHTTLQTKCFDFQTAAASEDHRTARRRLFTGGQRDDGNIFLPSTTFCFWPFCSRLRTHTHKPSFNTFHYTKGATDPQTLCTRTSTQLAR